MLALGVDAELAAFWADPIAWLGDRDVRRIIQVSRDDDPTLSNDPFAPEYEAPQDGERRIEPLFEDSRPIVVSATGPTVVRMRHETPLALKTGADWIWSLKFFVASGRLYTNTFLSELRILGLDDGILKKPAEIGTLVRSSEGVAKLKHAYKVTVGAGRLNWTSLSMLSSPAPHHHVEKSHVSGGDRTDSAQLRYQYAAPKSDQVAWLGTGDAELGTVFAASELSVHYAADKLRSVCTLALPHHGSRHNFDGALLYHLEPRIAFATANAGSEHHPSQSVVSALQEDGITVLTVTSRVESVLRESFALSVQPEAVKAPVSSRPKRRKATQY
jgi:hypothetical protein